MGRTFCVHRTPKSTSSSALPRISRSAVIVVCQQSSPAFSGRNFEEAATPGQASTRHRVSGNPPAVHPREPPETSGIFRCSSRHVRLDRACVRAMCLNRNSGSREKSVALVTKLWRMSIICGKHRKTRMEIRRTTPTTETRRHRESRAISCSMLSASFLLCVLLLIGERPVTCNRQSFAENKKARIVRALIACVLCVSVVGVVLVVHPIHKRAQLART